MGVKVLHRTGCLLCGFGDLKTVLRLVPTPIAGEYLPRERLRDQETYPLDLGVCLTCNHVQLLDVLDPRALYEHFEYRTASSPGLARHYDDYAHEVIARYQVPKASLVLDIGSNDGTLLRAFQRRGMRVLGVEPCREIAEDATASGIQTLNAFFGSDLAKEILSAFGRPSIVVSNYTMANVPDVADMVEGIRCLLPPDGVFVFETGYLLDLVRGCLTDTIYHEHLSYFAVGPLVPFFRRHGMELIDIEWFPTKGGAIRGAVQPRGGSRPVSTSVGRFMTLEDLYGIKRTETYRLLDERLQVLKERLHALLGQPHGRRVAGYGACHGATTLIYHFRLGDLIEFLVDDDPRKHLTFSPGLHIPVLDPGALETRRPDWIVVFAWRYAQAIVERHPQFRGTFVIPLPEVMIR